MDAQHAIENFIAIFRVSGNNAQLFLLRLPRKWFHTKYNISVFPLFSHVCFHHSLCGCALFVLLSSPSRAIQKFLRSGKTDDRERKHDVANLRIRIFIFHSATPLFHQRAFVLFRFSLSELFYARRVRNSRNWEDFHVFRSVSNVQSSMAMTPVARVSKISARLENNDDTGQQKNNFTLINKKK